MQALGGEGGRAEWATVSGVCRVAGQEMGGVRWRSVDVEEGEGVAWAGAAAERVVGEVRSGVREAEVAWRGGRRWVRSYEQVQSETASDPRAPLRRGGVYLITGGLEGVGFEVAKHLAEKAGAKLVLVEDVSTESFPSGGTASASVGDERPKHPGHVSLLESLGAEVSVAEADVADEGQMRSVLARAVERFGVIHGVIHAAGVSGERTFRAVVETGEAESAWQFRPKVFGTYVLGKIFQGRDVDFLVLASSLSSVLGGRGLTAYCAASRFLDAFAQAASQTGGPPWLSVNFDAWETAGESEGAKPLMNSRVTHLSMTNAEGAEAFHRALSMREVGQVLISTTDLRRRAAEQERAIHPSKSAQKETSAEPLEAGREGDDAPARGLEEIVTAAWRKGLGVREVGLDDHFFDLGGDSLIAIQVISQLKKELGVDIPVVSLYEGLTVRYLVGLLRKLTDEGPAGAADSVTTGQRKERASRRRDHIERQRARRTPVHQ
jgi:NAD(P)-dependent dehydrogenase (short-subunit alcohol dehydrogenase family)/acyl carrier protein